MIDKCKDKTHEFKEKEDNVCAGKYYDPSGSIFFFFLFSAILKNKVVGVFSLPECAPLSPLPLLITYIFSSLQLQSSGYRGLAFVKQIEGEVFLGGRGKKSKTRVKTHSTDLSEHFAAI